MSDISQEVSKLFKGTSVVFLGSVIGKVLSLVAIVIMTNSLSPDEFGTIGLAQSIIVLLGLLAVLGAEEGLTQQLSSADNEDAKIQLIQSGFLISISLSLILSIGLLYLGEDISAFMGDAELVMVLKYMIPYMIAFPMLKVSLGVLRSLEKSVAPIISREIVGKLIGLVVLAIFVLYGDPILGAITYWVIVPVLSLMMSLAFVHREMNIVNLFVSVPQYSSFKQLFAFSVPLAMASSLVILMGKTDILLLGRLSTVDNVGLYRSVQPLSSIAGFVLSSTVFLFVPIATKLYANSEIEKLQLLYQTTTKWIVTVSFPLVLCMVLYSEDIIRLVLSPNYKPASIALSLLTIGMFSRIIVGPNGGAVTAVGRPMLEFYAALVGLITNILLNILLIPQFGLSGAAIATGLGYLMFNLVEVLMLYKIHGIRPPVKDSFLPMLPTIFIGGLVKTQFLQTSIKIYTLVLVSMLIFVTHVLSSFLITETDDTDYLLLRKVEAIIGREVRISSSWFSLKEKG